MAIQSTTTEFRDAEPRLIEWSELRRRIPLSRSTVWRLIRDGKFPAPLRISPGRVAWPENEIEVWRAAQKRSA